jgi:glutathione S-transferase
VTLTEAGASFEVRPLNFRRSAHMSQEYLQLNPKHKVPLLVIDGERLTPSGSAAGVRSRTDPIVARATNDPRASTPPIAAVGTA